MGIYRKMVGQSQVLRLRTAGISARSHKATTTLTDRAASALAVACGMNLNGVASMAFNLEQAVSIVMLLASLYLMMRCWRFVWSAPMKLMAATIVTWLILGTLLYDPRLSVYEPTIFYLPNLSSVLIIGAIAGYTASLADEVSKLRWLASVRNIFVVSSLSVWASPLLYKYYVNLPLSADPQNGTFRMGGFFANPNEAAIVSVIALALLLVQPVRIFALQVLLLCVAIGATVLTFSKTGMSCLVILLAFFAARRFKGYALFLAPILAALILLMMQDPRSFIETAIENPVIGLSQSQKSRLRAVGDILSGQINEKTTTHRSAQWNIVISRAWDVFPLGNGLGSANAVKGGIREGAGGWLGVHNTFLMLWGEAGIMPPLLLIWLLVTLILQSMRRRLVVVQVGLFILVVDMMATHTALATRYHNLLLGLVIGAASLRTRSLLPPTRRPVP